MRRLITGIFVLSFAVLCGMPPAFSQARDVASSSDHPAVGRYEGARISFYQTKAYEELELPFKGLDRSGQNDPSAWKVRLAGELASIRYEGPDPLRGAGRSLHLGGDAQLRSRLAGKGLRDSLLLPQ